MDEVVRLPEDFSGRVRLFPLPELVVFPHAMQPLHIFEPRYCDMLADSLADDRLIAMATLQGGPEQILVDEPAIHRTVCIGKVVSHVETDEGHHNILLIGAQRAKILRELPTNRSFRMADVEVAAEFQSLSPDSDSGSELKRSVLEAFASVIPATATVQQNLLELMAGQMGLGPITDIISFTLPLGTPAKLTLLAEADIIQRATLLVRLLRERFAEGSLIASDPSSADDPSTGGGPLRPFPPNFSDN